MNRTGERRIRFGPYEADLAAGRLRKNGRRVRLQEQPFQVLAALLDRPGEVITREELRERLWPDDSFGDFDQSLNTAINKLREALGDSAATPRFVETLPKRGYRFMHPVEGEPAATPGDAVGIKRQPVREHAVPLAIAAALAITASVFAVLWMVRPAPDSQLPFRRFALRLPVANISTPDAQLVAISPNGRHVAIIAGEGLSRLWIQDLDQEQPRAIEGSEGALGPFWSPDSATIGFAAGGKVKKVSVNGGPVIPLCELPVGGYISGGSWSADGGLIVFTAGAPTALYMVAAAGGTATLAASPQMLDEPGEPSTVRSLASGWISQPHFLPSDKGARAVLFTYFAAANPLVMTWDLKTGRHRIIGTGRDPTYSSTGHLLYESGTDLWAQPFSPKSQRVLGDAFRIARNAADSSVASDGTLVYRDTVTEDLAWFDRRGARIGAAGQPADGMYYPTLSPDGHRVAAEMLENGNQDVWVSDVLRGARIRLTSHPALEVLPVWAPGGDEIAFSSYRAGNIDVFVRRADAGSEEQPLAATRRNERVSDWSQDGQNILYSLLHRKNGYDLWYLKRNAGGKWEPYPLLQTSFNEKVPKFSPDGRYVAYMSDESGRDEVYVREFRSGGRRWLVSSHGGSQIRWSRNGRELFYTEGGALIAVPVDTIPEFAAGTATRLFSHAAFIRWDDPNYDVSADGQRIYLPERVGTQEPMVRVVQNWYGEFGERR